MKTENTNCLFCRIVADELPSYKLYEDNQFFVMLDRFPKCIGHVLVLPKHHAPTFFDLRPEDAAGLLPLAQRVAVAMRAAIPFDGLNLLQNNGKAAEQAIDHFHLHLIPRFYNDDMTIHYPKKDPAPTDFDAMFSRIKAHL